jgi:hypothetical protein
MADVAEHCVGLRDVHSVIRAITSERGLGLAWRREVVKTSIRALLSVACYRPEKRGLAEIRISRTISPRWNAARWRLGAEILLRISREFGKNVEWLLTGQK